MEEEMDKEKTKMPSGDLIRIGIIGFGVRAKQLSNALGSYVEKRVVEWDEKIKKIV